MCLKRSEARILLFLQNVEAKERYASAISIKLDVDIAYLYNTLKKMTEKSLLAVIKDEHDKRKRLIQLTQSGQALENEAADIPKTILCKFESVDPTQAKQLMQLLDLVISDLTTKNDDELAN